MSDNPSQGQEIDNPFETFDPDIRLAVDGLIHLGYLETQVEFCGHIFVLRTLRPNELLAIAQVHKPYQDTIRAAEAWAAAHIALALLSVDNDETFCPQAGPDLTAFAHARFNYVTSRWFPPVIDYLYREYNQLETQAEAATSAIANLSKGSLPTFSPSVDSWTAPGISVGPISGGNPSTG